MEDKYKLFAMSNLITESSLNKIETQYNIDLMRNTVESDINRDNDYYPQFPIQIRNQAKTMSKYYELFYCIEVYLRGIVKDILLAEHGQDWWNTANISESIRKNVQDNIKKEQESSHSIRSDEEIDYTTFGELSEIIKMNWKNFADIFNNEKAFTKVTSTLNMLRGPIAHCSHFAEDEELRLKLMLKDLFRLME